MQEYVINVPGGMETTVLLPDDEAEKRGLKPVAKSAAKAKTAPNKAKSPENKSSAADKRAEAVSRAMNKPSKSGDA